MNLSDWFLTPTERGNPSTDLPAWSAGNRAEPLIHGSTYFDRLVTEVEGLQLGDYVFFTDWRGDPDEKMRDDGPTVAELFGRAAERGRRPRLPVDLGAARAVRPRAATVEQPLALSAEARPITFVGAASCRGNGSHAMFPYLQVGRSQASSLVVNT